MSIFQKFTGLADILRFLVNIKQEDIQLLIESVGIVSDEGKDLEARVKAALVVADIVTDYVPGELDDQVVDAIKDLLDQETIWDLVESIQSLMSNQGKVQMAIGDKMASMPGGFEVKVGDEKKAIPWPVIISVASLIIDLIKMLEKKGGDQ